MLRLPRHSWWLVPLCVVVYALIFQGVRPLYSPDEGRYTDVALAMLDDGDWVHPMLHHEVEHWSKPPLTYWAIASSLGAFGRSEWAARLPSALAFAGTILLVLRLGRRFSPATPWLPGVVYATCGLPWLASNLVTTDTLLAFWEAFSVIALLALRDAVDIRARRRFAAGLGVTLALAFMTKGPPGLLSFAGVLAGIAWCDGLASTSRLFRWETPAVFIVVGLSWFGYVVAQDPGVLRYFLVEEVVNRVASDKMHRNDSWYGAFKIYVPALIVGALPWSWIVMKRAWSLPRDLRGVSAWHEDRKLLAAWLLVPALVFFIARSRLPLYILPLFVPLSLVIARSLAWRTLERRVLLLASWCAILIAGRVVPAFMHVEDDDRRLARRIASLVSPRPAEIAFVETAPRFGLRFYLGSEIERIRLFESGTPHLDSQDLGSELVEDEGCRLFVTDADAIEPLWDELAARSKPAMRLPDIGSYRLIAQLTPDCPWTLDARPDNESSPHQRTRHAL